MLHTWNRFDDEDDIEWLFTDLMIEHHDNFFGTLQSANPSIDKFLSDALKKSDEQLGDTILKEWNKLHVQTMLDN